MIFSIIFYGYKVVVVVSGIYSVFRKVGFFMRFVVLGRKFFFSSVLVIFYWLGLSFVFRFKLIVNRVVEMYDGFGLVNF